MRFFGRWIGGALNIALALLVAILAMQAPAFTHDYAAGLLQVAEDARRDVDQREASARRFYAITAASDDEFVTALEPHEPSNAQTLALSLDRVRRLHGAHDRIAGSTPLLQPLVAVIDALDDEHGYKAAVWSTALNTYVPHVDFSAAAATYGLAGLLLGSLVAQLLIVAGRRFGTARRLAGQR